MDNIKEAFKKVKQDIETLKQEVIFLAHNLSETKESMVEICEIIKKLSEDNKRENNKDTLQTAPTFPTDNQKKPAIPTHNPTHEPSLNPLKSQNIAFSTGNEGVPTNRQTDQQTDQHIKNQVQIIEKTDKNSIEDAARILESLDNIKKEIRLKFKRLTDQELLVFSTIYQLEEEGEIIDYRRVSKKLNLTESSIRDYVGKLIKKGIPIEKKKINNKNINISISQNLKKIATLSTILQLRDL